jgi:predicted GIY-YIG superfamily endonuclease
LTAAHSATDEEERPDNKSKEEEKRTLGAAADRSFSQVKMASTAFTYLLTPLSGDHRGATTYIGVTGSPSRRIRQHNRDISGGARATELHHPWEMICVLQGFASTSTALSFEWAWQHGGGHPAP